MQINFFSWLDQPSLIFFWIIEKKSEKGENETPSYQRLSSVPRILIFDLEYPSLQKTWYFNLSWKLHILQHLSVQNDRQANS